MDRFVETDVNLLKIGEKIDFNMFIFLPLNKKFIHFHKKGYEVDNQTLVKCKRFKVEYLCVPVEDFSILVEYIEKNSHDKVSKINVIHIAEETGELIREEVDVSNTDISLRHKPGLKVIEERREIGSAIEEIYGLKDEKEAFYEYEAQLLTDIYENESISDSEKASQAKLTITDLIEEFLNTEPGSFNTREKREKMINHSKNIAALLIDNLSKENNAEIYENLMGLILSSSSVWTHSVYVSTFSVIFAIAAGIVKSESLVSIALGGLMHDVGISTLDDYSMLFREDDLNEKELAIYQTHCMSGLNMLKESNCKISPITEAIILSHHENYDGSGFPNAIRKARISDAVAVVSIADSFDMLLNKNYHPLMALKKIRDDNIGINKGNPMRYRPFLVEKIMDFFNLDERVSEFENKMKKTQS
jgi:response regulator RpfG family c-di-GMP phosphodiesterase